MRRRSQIMTEAIYSAVLCSVAGLAHIQGDQDWRGSRRPTAFVRLEIDTPGRDLEPSPEVRLRWPRLIRVYATDVYEAMPLARRLLRERERAL